MQQGTDRPDEPEPPAEAPQSIQRIEAEVVQPVKQPREVLPPEAAPAIQPIEGGRLKSEKVVISAAMSYAGSAARIWPISRLSENGAATAGLVVLALLFIALAWVAVTLWYIVTFILFGILFIPYRLIRRGNWKRKVESLRHREQLQMQQQTQDLLRQREDQS